MKKVNLLGSALGFLLTGCLSLAHAVGFQQLTVGDARIQIGIWYPSKAAADPLAIGSVTQSVALNGAIEGATLPLVIISHGSGGSFLGHYDTAVALADAGYVVASLTHPGDNYADQSRSVAIMDRPRHVSAVIDYMLRTWTGHLQINPARIGIIGHSAGGFTALVSVGGVADLSRVAPFCQEHAGDFACKLLARQSGSKLPATALPGGGLDARIKAAVVAAPAVGFTFSADGLKNVTVPVQLWRAENDVIVPHPWYAEAIRLALPQAPEYHVVPKAGHFDFLAPCSKLLLEKAPAICSSEIGFDRVAFHAAFNESIVKFFGKTLKASPVAMGSTVIQP